MSSRPARLAFSRTEKVLIAVIYAVIITVTVLGLLVSVAIGRVTVILAGLGVVAYVFGLRHGVDADHIVAIDNTIRKLLQEGQRPFTVGLWFSLGHSTIVVALTVALVIGTRIVATDIPYLQNAGSVIGTVISGSFLWIIGLVNAIILAGVYRIFQELRRGRLKEAELEAVLEQRGLLNRYFRILFKVVRRPWQIYPVGVLFGLGFDTASEVALLAISVGVGVSSNVPLYYILVLPLMFTCGMVLVDTTDGIAMRMAYGWTFFNPLRKVYYNLTVTTISVLVAWVIGAIELLQVLSNEFSLKGAFWDYLNGLDFETLGFGIIAIFLLSWLVSWGWWKINKLDKIAP